MSLDQLLESERRQSPTIIPFLQEVRSLPCVSQTDAEKIDQLISKTRGH
jgi:hypothetical protein